MKLWKLILALALAWTSVAEAGVKKHAKGLKRPPNWLAKASFDSKPCRVAALPKHWNWNDYGILQPIRNQGGCGSCWAFSVTAVVESLHRLLHPELYPYINLAEQTLVSTCETGGDCNGGYFDAFDYVKAKGLPEESQDPYRAANSSCKSGLVPAAKITEWHYIGSASGATTDQIKQAILDHGPVSVDVNGDFSYNGGVYTACGSTSTNHMVVLDGWQDDPAYAAYGGGYWYMRNSWGTSWGEKGYMRIVFNAKNSTRKCNGIANVSAYAVEEGVTNLAQFLGIPTL